MLTIGGVLLVNDTFGNGLEEHGVKYWVVDLEALLESPEVARLQNVKLPYHVIKDYSAIESNIRKKEVILHAIRTDDTKVVHDAPKKFLELNETEYGLITSDITKFANTELTRPVITPSEILKVGYTGVEYFDVHDEKLYPYLSEGLFNGHSGQFVHDFELIENQYVILGNRHTRKDRRYYIVRDGQLDEIDYNSGIIKGINGEKTTPKNDRQRLAMDLLHRRDVTVKLLTGVVGSGKDYLMLNKAVELIADPRTDFNKLVFIRNNTITEGVNDIGFLPNGLNDKLKPYMMPLVDICGGMDGFLQVFGSLEDKSDKDEYEEDWSDNQLNSFELVYLGHAKGRTWDNAIIYVTEAEDLAPHHAKLIVSRAGEGTEVWMNGDEEQADTPQLKTSNGIQAVKELRGNKSFGTVQLDKTERSDTAKLAGLL